MKKVFLVFVILILLLMDWIALNKILKGEEINQVTEYATLAGSVVLMAVLISYNLQKK